MSHAVRKALGLLELVAKGHHSLAELAASGDMPRSTAHRLATTLVEEGFLMKDRQNYRLGYRLLELGQLVKADNYLVSAARESMEQLSAQTKETVHLGQLEGTEIVYIEKVTGQRGLQMVSRVGLRTLAQTTSLGKVLIAHRPESEWLSHLVEGTEARTPYTIVGLDATLEELRKVRQKGYALDCEENELGIRCVAAPIRDRSGQVVAAISLSGASVYVTEARQLELVPVVDEAARAISARLSG